MSTSPDSSPKVIRHKMNVFPIPPPKHMTVLVREGSDAFDDFYWSFRFAPDTKALALMNDVAEPLTYAYMLPLIHLRVMVSGQEKLEGFLVLRTQRYGDFLLRRENGAEWEGEEGR